MCAAPDAGDYIAYADDDDDDGHRLDSIRQDSQLVMVSAVSDVVLVAVVVVVCRSMR